MVCYWVVTASVHVRSAWLFRGGCQQKSLIVGCLDLASMWPCAVGPALAYARAIQLTKTYEDYWVHPVRQLNAGNQARAIHNLSISGETAFSLRCR